MVNMQIFFIKTKEKKTQFEYNMFVSTCLTFKTISLCRCPILGSSASSVSQYSDENMMQPYNLAVCFGPSLVRGTHNDDVVALQPLINALVKNIILQHESIFPSQSELQGPAYEKCMTLEQDDW